jgi:8-oxo-dGTP pyrophosphatase MutT (NUDIX family)
MTTNQSIPPLPPPPNEGQSPWITQSTRAVYANPWISVSESAVITPRGAVGIYGVVHFKQRGVGVIPVDAEGQTTLVGQYRYPLSRYSWEIPSGGGDPGESSARTAIRELQEETGLAAAALHPLLTVASTDSITDEWLDAHVAWDLTEGARAPDETEQLLLHRAPLAHAFHWARSGAIFDALSAMALMRLELMLRAGDAPTELAQLVSCQAQR